MKKLCIEDWEFYRMAAHWEPLEAACLLKGILPESLQGDIPTDIKRVLTLMKRACLSRTLETQWIDMENIDSPNIYQGELIFFTEEYHDFGSDHHGISAFSPYVFVLWASECGFLLPPELEFEGEWAGGAGYDAGNKKPIRFKNLAKQHQANAPSIEQQKENHLTIDLNDKNLSDELKASLKAWTTLYMEKEDISELKGKVGHIKTIKKWVGENFPKEQFSAKALDRIATVVNPDKKGGTPTTPN